MARSDGRAHRHSKEPLETACAPLYVPALRFVGGDELLDAPEAELQLVLGLGVGEADESLARRSERRPGQHGHAGLVEKTARELMLVETRALDVREDIERALGPGTANPRDLVHAADHQVAAVLEDLDHAAHRVLRLG